tara:strand:+ start:867 stop:1301 length:435 start_codon:yes stop_codon:yes gene_type:complete
MVLAKELSDMNGIASKKVIDCLRDLYHAYPEARAYNKNTGRRNKLVEARHCFKTSSMELSAVHEKVRAELALNQKNVRELLLRCEILRKKNSQALVRLQSKTNAAAGAIGMYDDVTFMYNSRVLQIVMVAFGGAGMAYSIYDSE